MRSCLVPLLFVAADSQDVPDGYDVKAGERCKGESLLTYPGNEDSGYGAEFPKTVKDCAALCTTHIECIAFSSNPSKSRCSYWMETLSKTTPEDGWDCYSKKSTTLYEVQDGKKCSGQPIDDFKKEDCKEDKEPSDYGQQLGKPKDVVPKAGEANIDNNKKAYEQFKADEEARCAQKCDENSDCRGFSSHESSADVDTFPGFKDYKCSYWRNGDLTKGQSSAGYKCHTKKSTSTGKCNSDGTSPSGDAGTTTTTTTVAPASTTTTTTTVASEDSAPASPKDASPANSEGGHYTEVTVNIPKPCPRTIPKEEIRTRSVDVPVPVPVTVTQDIPCPVPTPVQVPVPVTQTVHVRVPVPNIIDRPVPTPVTVQVQVPVPVPTPVPNPIPCPVPQTIQQRVAVPVFVDRYVDVPVPVPVPVQMQAPVMAAPSCGSAPMYMEQAPMYMEQAPMMQAPAIGYGQPMISDFGGLSGVSMAGPAMPSL